jgi:hypothetical protein
VTTPAAGGTSRPFTAAVCTSCAAGPATQLLLALRGSIRRCPHGMLVTTGCLLGEFTCAVRPSGEGAVLVLQPCSVDRTPAGPARWVGPVRHAVDARVVCDWLERGDWELDALPSRLSAEWNFAKPANRN